MKSVAWLIPVLTATVSLLRLANLPSSTIGMLDNWACVYPEKRLAFKTAELVVDDRML